MNKFSRQPNLFDQIIINFDTALKAIAGTSHSSKRPSPAGVVSETPMDAAQRKESLNLMRVNHVGEVCAQALYQGQSLTARSPKIQEKLGQAAQEEQDHLAWCEQRIRELGGHPSYLNPFWYLTSLMIGAIAGLLGDSVNLGFLAETEHQVEQHLAEHLIKIPSADQKSLAILEQMRIDELHHAHIAEEAGAATLPEPVKVLMRLLSKIMTTSTYWI